MLPGLERWAFAASEFVGYLKQWNDRLVPLELGAVLEEAGGPEGVAVFVVDMVEGFCREGALQSDRVARTIDPIVELLVRADRAGVGSFVLVADEHCEDALEFVQFPVHCVRGSFEAELVHEIARLPFASRFTVIRKRSIHPSIGTALDRWLEAHGRVTHRIVVGAGTDLGVYQTAMHLKLTANVRNVDRPVILPANCTETFDVPTDLARAFGIPAHPGDALRAIFLHHMHLNGIRVVSELR